LTCSVTKSFQAWLLFRAVNGSDSGAGGHVWLLEARISGGGQQRTD